MRNAQRDVLAPWRGYDLNADGQRRKWNRHGHHRQADEGDRLCEDTNVGSQWDLGTLKLHRLLTDARGGEWSGGGAGGGHPPPQTSPPPPPTTPRPSPPPPHPTRPRSGR